MLDATPASFGHLSSLSNTPSPSVSGQGQPLFSAGPAVFGHLSFPSTTPSPSASGHPLLALVPASVGQASSLSAIPSPSASGQPFKAAKPATSGQASSESLIPSPSVSEETRTTRCTTAPRTATPAESHVQGLTRSDVSARPPPAYEPAPARYCGGLGGQTHV